jgi:hypothetical protein
MASICSVTFIEPSSAPMPAPTRPLTTNPVTIGPISWMIEYRMAAGSMDFAPKCSRLLRLSSARTVPTAAPARATRGSDFDPISSNCRMISRISNGLVTAAHITFQEKFPRSPNHSSERLIVIPVEVEVDSINDEPCAPVLHSSGLQVADARATARGGRTRVRMVHDIPGEVRRRE